MRMLVICLSLGTLLWLVSKETQPNIPMLVGFMTLTGLTLTRLFKRLALPSLLGAPVAGCVLGISYLLPSQTLIQTQHLFDFSLSWTGLFIGAGLTPQILTNTRLYKGALCLYFPPVVISLAFFLIYGLSLPLALSLASLSGISMILFLPPHSKMRGEIIPLGKLTICIGLILWVLFTPHIWRVVEGYSLSQLFLSTLLYIGLLESAVQICKVIKTNTSKHITFLILAYLLALSCYGLEFSAFFLAFPAGIYLSFRQAHTPLLTIPSLTEAIIAFALISFSLTVFQNSPPITTYTSIPILILYILILLIGKILGGLCIQHFFKFPSKVWIPLLPQGFVVFLCLHTTPAAFFAPSGTLHIAVWVVLFGLSFIYPFYYILMSKIKKDPLTSYSRRVL